MSADLTESNSLADLAARINAQHAEMVRTVQRGVDHAIAAGELLLEAKAKVPHGRWLPWLEANCTIPERTAQLYMRIARERAAIEAKSATVADLTIRGAVALISSPDFRRLLNHTLEMIDAESVIAAYEAAEAEHNTRRTAYVAVDEALTKIMELASSRPAAMKAALAVADELGDRLLASIQDCTEALKADLNEPCAKSPRATTAILAARDLATKMLADVGAAS
jgi:hypothetical protein